MSDPRARKPPKADLATIYRDADGRTILLITVAGKFQEFTFSRRLVAHLLTQAAQEIVREG